MGNITTEEEFTQFIEKARTLTKDVEEGLRAVAFGAVLTNLLATTQKPVVAKAVPIAKTHSEKMTTPRKRRYAVEADPWNSYKS